VLYCRNAITTQQGKRLREDMGEGEEMISSDTPGDDDEERM